jgi:hypothetical protein
MARYLLIEVDSNATADKLRAQIDSAGEAKGMRVVGLFSRGLVACECPTPARHPQTNSVIDVRGSKLGWMICPNCGKPRNGAGQVLWNLLDQRHLSREHFAFRAVSISLRWVLGPNGKLTTDRGQG